MPISQQVVEQVRAIASPIVRALGLELVEVVCLGQGPRTLVRVCIDKPGGVRVVDCEQVHQSLGYALDVEDPIQHAYTLEVSSPGLERPFASREGYLQARGKLVRVKLRSPHAGQWRVIGRLLEVEDSGVQVALTERRGVKTVFLSWENIAQAQREIEF